MATTFKAFVVILVAAIFASTASAQDFNLSPSQAPAPDTGAAGSVSGSVTLIGVSLVLSMLAILKNN